VLATTNGWVGQSGLLAVPIDSGTVHLPLLEGARIVTAQPVSPNQSYWINGSNNNQYVQWAVETGSGVGGSAAAVARPGPAASGGSANYIQALRTYYFPVWPNTPYTIRFSYQANGPGFSGANDATGSQLQFQALESPYLTGGNFLSTAGTNILNRTTGWTSEAYVFTTTPGTHCLCLKFGVMFGNGNQTNPADSFYLDDDCGVTMVLGSTANPSPYGQPLNFTATVVPINPALGTPTGTVQFQTNGVDFGDAVTLSGGKATSEPLPQTLLLGNYTVTAVYSGDINFTAGNGALANGQTIYLQTAFTYNGTAQGPSLGGIWPDGTNAVSYMGLTYQGDPYVGTGAPTNAGSYYVTNTTVVDNNGNGPTNCQGFVILKATNAVQLTSSSVSSTYGDTVTFTGLIQTNGVTAQDATGNLIFTVDGAMVATNALTNSVATYSTSSLTATGHNITVTYSGDNNYTNNATGMIAQNVTPASSAFSDLTASQSITYGTENIDLDGRLTASMNLYPPKGEVLNVTIAGLQTNATLLDDLGNFRLSFPTATFPASALPYTINYAYAGNINFIGATNIYTSLTVNQAVAMVSLGSLSQTYNGAAINVTVSTTPTNLPVHVTYNDSSIQPTNAGLYTVAATILNPNYQGFATNTLVILQAPQTIAFDPLPGAVYGDSPFTLTAAASSGLPVSFASSDSTVASVGGSKVSILATGSVSVTASQLGNVNYLPTNVSQTLTVADIVAQLSIGTDLNDYYTVTNATLTISGNANRQYSIQYLSDLTQTNWQTLTVISNLPSAHYQVNDPATKPARYYRLVRPIWTPDN
jgi:MBG domain/Bacterial Ig-like domain (group 3)